MLSRRTRIQLTLLGLALGAIVCVLLVFDGGARNRATAAPPVVEPPTPVERAADEPVELFGDTRADTAAPELDELVLEAPAVEAGSVRTAPVVRGRVSDPSGFPLAGAHIGLRLGRGDLAATVATATTAVDGRYSIELDDYTSLDDVLDSRNIAPELREALGRQFQSNPARNRSASSRARSLAFQRATQSPTALTAAASFRGYQFAAESRKVAMPLPRETVIDFVLAPGAVFEGTVRDKNEGLPVPAAQVFLLDDLGVVIAEATTNVYGHWWMNLQHPGVYDLFARHESIGTAWMPALEIEPYFEHRVTDVLLTGDGRLMGRITYPDGRAVVGLALETRHESILFLDDGALREAERIDKERGLGLVIGGAATDVYGDFRVQGLQPGRHAIRFAEIADPTLQPPLLYSTESESIAIVFAGHRLRVSVQQSATPLLDLPQSTCDRLIEEPGRAPRVQRVGSWSGVGDWFCVVEPGERYLVRAWASGTQEDWTLVEIPHQPHESQASVALFPELKASQTVSSQSPVLGRVVVRVVDEQSRVLGGWLATLRNRETKSTVRGMRDVVPGEGGALPIVPPGEYELRLRTAPTDKAFVVLDDEWREVSVAPGVNAAVEVLASLGARLKLVTPKPAPGSEATSVRASARRKDSKEPIALQFLANDSRRTDRSAELKLGQSALCEPVLVPGLYTITIESTDETELDPLLRTEVTLDAGELEVIALEPLR